MNSLKRSLPLLVLCATAGVALGQNVGSYGLGVKPPPPSPEVLESLTIPEKTQRELLGKTPPLDGTFYDHAGTVVSLREVIGGKPTILVPVYFKCPMLCNRTIENLVTCLRAMRSADAKMVAGESFNLIFFSIDSFEHPQQANGRRNALHDDYDGRKKEVPGVWFLSANPKNTAERAKEAYSTIREVTDAIGFHFVRMNVKKQKEVDPDKTAQEIQHPTAVIVLTPTGAISSYNTQIVYDPNEMAEQVRAAGRGDKGSTSSFPSLSCFLGKDENGLYRWAMRILGWVALPCALGIVGYVVVAKLRSRAEVSKSAV